MRKVSETGVKILQKTCRKRLDIQLGNNRAYVVIRRRKGFALLYTTRSLPWTEGPRTQIQTPRTVHIQSSPVQPSPAVYEAAPIQFISVQPSLA